MSISSELLILNQTKQNINSAINLKGVTVTDEAFSAYPDKVRQIPSGTGTYESQIITWIEGTITTVVIPTGTTEIGNHAFNNCTNLSSVTIPNSVTSIGNYAFAETHKLTSITIPNTVTIIDTHAFEHSHLYDITIPNSVTSIGLRAFFGCGNLNSVTIGTGVTSIGNYAFNGGIPAGLSVTINATTPPTLGTDVFISGVHIYVPAESVLAYQTADGWMDYASRITAIP